MGPSTKRDVSEDFGVGPIDRCDRAAAWSSRLTRYSSSTLSGREGEEEENEEEEEEVEEEENEKEEERVEEQGVREREKEKKRLREEGRER